MASKKTAKKPVPEPKSPAKKPAGTLTGGKSPSAGKKTVPAKKTESKKADRKPVPAKSVEPVVPANPAPIAVPREIQTSRTALNTCSRRAYSFAELQILLEMAGDQNFKRYNPEDAVAEIGKPVVKTTVLFELPRAPKGMVAKKASAEDILGDDPFSETAAQDEESRIPEKWRGLYKDLLKLRANSQKSLDIYTAKLYNQESKEETGVFTSLGDHTADTNTEAFDRDVAIARIEKVKRKLLEISAAITRMKTGKYGIDEVTGRPISMERLKKIPYARRGTEEQRKKEKKQAQTFRRVPGVTLQDMLGADVETRRSGEETENPQQIVVDGGTIEGE